MNSFYPGWRAFVDKQPVAVRPANRVGRALPLPAGEHEVEMHFEPQSVRVGIFITLLTISFISVCFLAAQLNSRTS